jgi:hypothetical protein
METLCATRSVKVLKYLNRMVPKSIPRSSLHALEKLPSGVLSSLHTTSDWDKVTKDEKLKRWLSLNSIPSPRATVSGSLFNGTLIFARVIFTRPNEQDFSVSTADVQTAVNYATLAIVPIQRYASQYGPNSVIVSPTVIQFTANLTGDSFNEGDLEGWVEQIAQTARQNRVTNPCIVILHDRSLPASPTYSGQRNSYHSKTGNGTPFCYCLVFGQNLSVADNNHTIDHISTEKVYAHNLSHEVTEMVVDPLGDESNPEVCDACAGNCNNSQFDLFDQNGVFMGGTTDTASATGFSFFINAVVRPDSYDPATECIVQGGDPQSACIYAPPPAWNGPGFLTTVNNPVSVAGHFSSGDQRDLVVVGTSQGKIHEIFWHPAQSGIEGEDDVPVAFGAGTIVSVGTMYNVDQQRHVVLVGTTAGKVHEIYWKPETVGIEGQDDLPVPFTPGSIVAVTGLYDNNQQRYVALAGTTAGRVHEIYWKDDTVGVEGHDDLPVMFTPGSIVAVTAFYDSDQQRYVVVVGTNEGKLHEIFWKTDTVGIEGDDDLPVDFGSGSIVAVSGFYDINRKRFVVAVGTADGTVRQVYWKELTVGIEAYSTVAKFDPNSIVSLAAFYSVTDNVDHIVVALANGQLQELWVTPDI